MTSGVATGGQVVTDGQTSWRAAWENALAHAELDVAATEQLIAAFHDNGDVAELARVADWVEPSVLGPIPEQFAERARRLLGRQRDVSAQLAEAMSSARGQMRALAKLEEAESRPVYVDRAL